MSELSSISCMPKIRSIWIRRTIYLSFSTFQACDSCFKISSPASGVWLHFWWKEKDLKKNTQLKQKQRPQVWCAWLLKVNALSEFVVSFFQQPYVCKEMFVLLGLFPKFVLFVSPALALTPPACTKRSLDCKLSYSSNSSHVLVLLLHLFNNRHLKLRSSQHIHFFLA